MHEIEGLNLKGHHLKVALGKSEKTYLSAEADLQQTSDSGKRLKDMACRWSPLGFS